MKLMLEESKKVLEAESNSLWQGNGADIERLTKYIMQVMDIIMQLMVNLSDEDKITTSAYLKDAMKDYEMAINKKDDYMLADCIYYEWREMLIIFKELLEGDQL